MKVHKLKLRIEYCDDVLKGNKTFEVRKNDRDFKVGDLIMFTPVDLTSECEHQISDELFVITYILSNFLILLRIVIFNTPTEINKQTKDHISKHSVLEFLYVLQHILCIFVPVVSSILQAILGLLFIILGIKKVI